MSEIIVQKYGGTSVGSPERIQAVADRIIETKQAGKQVVAIVSAMGKTTDHLVELAQELSNGNPDPREYDALLSTGEAVSAALLSMCLIAKGHPAISLSGAQAGISTEDIHGKAKIENVTPTRIHEAIDDGKIVIITGFQGISSCQDITTIGRGGSDTSAVIIAAALHCKTCQIFTDVDGVYTTDPRIVPEARKCSEIAYAEMLELASLGANVLHPRAVECAKEYGITIEVRSSFNTNEGTKVKESKTMEKTRAVTGVALKRDEAKLSILKVPDQPTIAAKVFTALSEAKINIDMIVQSTEQDGSNNITFTTGKEEFDTAKSTLEQVAKSIGAAGISTDTDIAKVSIVGVGMISSPGVAATMFQALGENNINIQLITTSEIKISCAIASNDAENAVRILHKAFELEKG